MSSTRRTRIGSVRFADTVQMYIVEGHEDVARHELWYTTAEIHSMRHAIEQDLLRLRAQVLARVPFDYAGDDDTLAEEKESRA
jgi:hypothetical protein